MTAKAQQHWRGLLLAALGCGAGLAPSGCGPGQYQLSEEDVAGRTNNGSAARAGDGQLGQDQDGNDNQPGSEDDKMTEKVDPPSDDDGLEKLEPKHSNALQSKAFAMTGLSSWGSVVSSAEPGQVWVSNAKVTASKASLTDGGVEDNVTTACGDFLPDAVAEPFYPAGLKLCWSLSDTKISIVERGQPLGEDSPTTTFRSTLWSDLGGLPAGTTLADLSVVGVGSDFIVLAGSGALVAIYIEGRSVERSIISLNDPDLPQIPDSVVSFKEDDKRSLLMTSGSSVFLGRRKESNGISWSKRAVAISEETPLEGAVPANEWTVRAYLTDGSLNGSVPRLLMKAGTRIYRLDVDGSDYLPSLTGSDSGPAWEVSAFLQTHCVACHGELAGAKAGVAFLKDGELNQEFLRRVDIQEKIRDRMERPEGDPERMPAAAPYPSQEAVGAFLDLLSRY